MSAQPCGMFCACRLLRPLGPKDRQLGADVGKGPGVSVAVNVAVGAAAVGVSVGVATGVSVNVGVGTSVGAGGVGVGVTATHWPVGPLQLALKMGTQPPRQLPLAPEPHARRPEKLH